MVCGVAADDATPTLGVSGNATMTSSCGGSDVITCKRRCRTSSLDCLSLIVDSLATSVAAEHSSALNSSFNGTTTASTIAWLITSYSTWQKVDRQEMDTRTPSPGPSPHFHDQTLFYLKVHRSIERRCQSCSSALTSNTKNRIKSFACYINP